MLKVTIPFDTQLAQGFASRVEDDHLRDIQKPASSRPCFLPPLDILCEFNPRKGADMVKIGAPHRQISGSGEAVLLDIPLLKVGEDAFVRLDRGHASSLLAPDP